MFPIFWFSYFSLTNLFFEINLILHCFHAKGTENMKKRGHGTLKGLKASNKRARAGNQKLKIEFSRLGGPVGENSRAFVDEIVVFTRKRKNIDQDVRDLIASDILVRFVVLLSCVAILFTSNVTIELVFLCSITFF